MSVVPRALAAAIALCGCAPAAARPAPASPGVAVEVRTVAAAPYGEEPAVTLAPAESAALAAVRDRLAVSGRSPRTSGALVLAARALARGAAAGVPEPIGSAARRAAMAAGSAYDPAPAAFLVRGRAEGLPALLASGIGAATATHVGVGAAEVDGTTIIVLLAAERRARLAPPFPRSVAPGATVTLSGALEGGLRRARIFATLPSGDVRELDARGDAAFRVPVTFSAPGRWVLEVIGEGRGGPEVAALLAVDAGAPPAPVPPGRAAPERAVADADAEAAVVAALNALRAAHGLPPLRTAPELAAAARLHSERMRDAGRIAHVLPGSGELSDRLRAASVPYRRAYENVAFGGTALAAHEAAEESPAHRANMLEPRATRIGVGLALGRLPSGGPAVYLTEILVEPPDDGSQTPLRPAARVRDALWRERARLGQPPLTADDALDALAAATAERMRTRDGTDPGDLDARALALRRKLAAVDVFVVSAPEDAIRSTNLRDRRFRRVGVGVATGDSRRFGAGRLFIAVVYTD